MGYEADVGKLRVETNKGGEKRDARDHEKCHAH